MYALSFKDFITDSYKRDKGKEKKKKEKKKEFTSIGKKQSLVAELNLEIQNSNDDWIVHTKTIAAFVVMNE